MLKTEIVSPYDLKPTHHLMYDKYKKLEDSENIEDILKTPIVLFGEEKYIYEGHYRTMLARMKKKDLPTYMVKSQKDFKELPKEHWDTSFTPEKHSYEDVLKILKESALADDEVFN
jgi:hypothetical protein